MMPASKKYVDQKVENDLGKLQAVLTKTLSSIQEDLQRAIDGIEEMGKNAGRMISLEKSFQGFLGELRVNTEKVVDVSSSVHRVETWERALSERLARIGEREKGLDVKESDLVRRIASLQQISEALKDYVGSTSEAAKSMQAMRDILEKEMEEVSGKIEKYAASAVELERADSVRAELGKREQFLGQATDLLKEDSQQLSNTGSQLSVLGNELRSIVSTLDNQGIVSSLTKRKSELGTEVDQLLAKRDEFLQSMEKRLEQVSRSIDSLSTSAESERALAQENLRRSDELNQLENKLKNFEVKLKAWQAELDEIEKRRQDKTDELGRLSAEIQAAKDEQARLALPFEQKFQLERKGLEEFNLKLSKKEEALVGYERVTLEREKRAIEAERRAEALESRLKMQEQNLVTKQEKLLESEKTMINMEVENQRLKREVEDSRREIARLRVS